MQARRYLSMAAAAVLLGLWAATAFAEPGGASKFIRSLGDQAIRVMQSQQTPLEARERQFRTLLAEGFDIDFISQFALGRAWQTATPDQRSSYRQFFGEYILKVYSSRFGGYSGETLSIVSERSAGQQDTVVATRIDRPSAPPIAAEWRVRHAGNSYKIIDVVVEGISMAATQRSEFAAVVKRDGLDGLINMLDMRTSKISATAAK